MKSRIIYVLRDINESKYFFVDSYSTFQGNERYSELTDDIYEVTKEECRYYKSKEEAIHDKNYFSERYNRQLDVVKMIEYLVYMEVDDEWNK